MNVCVRNMLLGAGLFISSAASHAMAIIDTGEGALTASGNALAQNVQWLAAEFILDEATYVTRIEGWLAGQDLFGNSYAGQKFTISVWNDGGDQPAYSGGAADLLYSNSATVTGVDVANWEGYDITFGQGLELAAGEYWVSFEIRVSNGNDYAGAMPGGAPNALGNEGFLTAAWQSQDNLDLGIRINGNSVNKVPSAYPLALLLIGSFSLGLGLRRR